MQKLAIVKAAYALAAVPAVWTALEGLSTRVDRSVPLRIRQSPVAECLSNRVLGLRISRAKVYCTLAVRTRTHIVGFVGRQHDASGRNRVAIHMLDGDWSPDALLVWFPLPPTPLPPSEKVICKAGGHSNPPIQ